MLGNPGSATRRLGLASQVYASQPEHHDYGSWQHGSEERHYQHPEMDARVVVRLDGWASAEVMAAYGRGEEGQVWPEFFYAVRIQGPAVEGERHALAGGKIPVSELERYAAETPGGGTMLWAWSFVLDQVEARL